MKKMQSKNNIEIKIAQKIAAIFWAPLLCATFFLFPFFTHASVDVKEPTNLGLIGYWSFNEGTSTTAHDFSGNGDNGTLVNSPIWVAGKRESALNFVSASSQYVTVSNSPVFNTSTLSVCTWVKPSSFSNYQSILAKSENGNYEQFGLLVNSSGAVAFQLGQFGTAFLGSLSIGKWSYICGTTDGTTGTLYINGVSQGTGTDAKSYSASYSFRIGNTAYGSNSRYFNGIIDEVRVYNRALSVSEITTLYKAGAAKITTANTTSGSPLAVNTEDNKLTKGLTGFWSFNALDMSGATAFDLSGQGNNVTLTGSPTAVAGMVGQALSFNGSTMSGASGSNVGITGTAPRTVNAWVNYTALPSAFAAFAGWGTTGTSHEWQLAIEGSCSTKYLAVWIYGSACTGDLDSTTVPTPGKWYMVTGIYDGTTASIYVNGVLQGTKTIALNTQNSALQLANGNSKSNAKIDEVRVYNRAISPSEVQELYQTGLVIINGSQTNRVTSGLVGYWTFDGKNMNWGSGTATDSSGNGNNGVLTNMSTTTSPVAGKIGQALKFNGTNSIVALPSSLSSSIFSGGVPFTVSAWVYPTVSKVDEGILSSDLAQANNENLHTAIRNGVPWFGFYGDDVSGGSVPLNKWSFLTFVYSGSSINTRQIYVNGVLVASDSPTGVLSTSGGVVAIGVSYLSTDVMQGNIDEVRVYNTTLSAAQVEQLYLAGH